MNVIAFPKKDPNISLALALVAAFDAHAVDDIEACRNLIASFFDGIRPPQPEEQDEHRARCEVNAGYRARCVLDNGYAGRVLPSSALDLAAIILREAWARREEEDTP